MNNNLEKILSNLMNKIWKKSYEILWITIWQKKIMKSYE